MDVVDFDFGKAVHYDDNTPKAYLATKGKRLIDSPNIAPDDRR
jgi:hypothetical protein